MIETAIERLLVAAPVLFAIRMAAQQRWRMLGHHTPTFVFADLAGYTALTERRGDQVAAGVAREFRRTMSAVSRRHGAWQVKSMGDGVMICGWRPWRGPTRRSSAPRRGTPPAGHFPVGWGRPASCGCTVSSGPSRHRA
jgi:hypothetical protein